MARAGYRIFDADTHVIEPAEPIESYLSAADRARLAALGPLVQRAPARGGMSRYRVGKRPELNRRLGSRERAETPAAITRGLKDGGTHEGEQSLRHAIEALGEDTLMSATDYPHSESWFPKSVDAVLRWTSIPETAKQKLLWGNAMRCYRRYAERAKSVVPTEARA